MMLFYCPKKLTRHLLVRLLTRMQFKEGKKTKKKGRARFKLTFELFTRTRLIRHFSSSFPVSSKV